jgi:hypothetical protein
MCRAIGYRKRWRCKQDYAKTVVDERSRVLQRNEKTKGWSTLLFNFGTALVASAFGRWWLVGIDLWVILWGVGGIFLLKGGIDVLGNLEAESWDG